MQNQIDRDLAPFKELGISDSEVHDQFFKFARDMYVLRFTIQDQKVSVEDRTEEPGLAYRIDGFKIALQELCNAIEMPNVSFCVFMHDGLSQPEIFSSTYNHFPLFVMSRARMTNEEDHTILIPDYENLRGNYQVLKGRNVEEYSVGWVRKKDQLVWRGSTAQSYWDEDQGAFLPSLFMNYENCELFSRYKLCQLSAMYPRLIDSKYTFFAGLDETYPPSKQYSGKRISYEDQFGYKYHILLNGNAAPYTCSGWKFFTESLVFIPECQWTQWYFSALVPYVHYVPVASDLSDLLEKLEWAKHQPATCELIGKNAKKFARENINQENSLVYLYYLLNEYKEMCN